MHWWPPLTTFDLVQRLIQPAYIRLLKFNSKTDDETKFWILLAFNRVRVRASVIVLHRSSCWKKESILAIRQQTHLIRGDVRAQDLSQVIRHDEAAKQNLEKQFITQS